MLTIKYYNQQLNQSYDAKAMYQRWASYRSDVTAHLISDAQNVLIIGAGHLNDIELRVLLENKRKITLLDIDTDAIQRGLSIQGIDPHKVKMVAKDLTDLDQDYFFERVLYLLQSQDYIGLQRYFATISNQPNDLALQETFDHIIISPIYTQLLLPQYYDLANAFTDLDNFSQAMEPFMMLITRVIQRVNQSMLQLSCKKRLTVWSDVLEYENNDDQLRQIKYFLANQDTLSIDRLYENYLKQYGHGLGSFGLQDLQKSLYIEQEDWLLWPFNKQRTLLVKLISGIVK